MSRNFDVIADLIGKPFEWGGRGPDAYDCFGLARSAAIRLGHLVIDWNSTENIAEIHAALESGSKFFDKVEVPRPGDLVLLQVRPPYVSHVGCVIEFPFFLHIFEKTRAVVERLDSPEWERRVKGYYRSHE